MTYSILNAYFPVSKRGCNARRIQTQIEWVCSLRCEYDKAQSLEYLTKDERGSCGCRAIKYKRSANNRFCYARYRHER